MKHFFSFLDSLTENLGIALLGAMTAIILLQVFFRYCLNHSLAWPEEAARYCFLWATYLGISIAMKNDSHLKIDLLELYLPKYARKIHALACMGFNMLFFGLLVFMTYDMMLKVKGLNQMAIALPLPVWLTWLGMCFSCLCCFLQAVRNFVLMLKND